MSFDPAPPSRPPTPIDGVAEAHLDAATALSPLLATYLGVAGSHDQIDDLSIAGVQERLDLARHTLDALRGLVPVDDVDRVSVDALSERLSLEVETGQRVVDGTDPVALNVIESPVQALRDTVDIMPKSTAEDWAVIGVRLRAVPTALQQYASALRFGAENGRVASRRQVARVIDQCSDQAGPDSSYLALLPQAARSGAPGLDDLEQAVAVARASYGELATFLKDELLDQAPEADAAGIERYQLASREFLGATIDLDETYQWGQQELERITALMAVTAEQIRPGASIREAVAILDADPTYQLHGTEALQEWMQVKADEAVAELADLHFDIPEPVRTIECLIAPTQTGGIYYSGPSEDFSRPGRMWWSVPRGVTEFGTWRELTTVYHEGVPGHHLQVAQTVYRSELLNRWRRIAAWTSGHGEGWALYAEWLMADLGYMDDPGNRMGLLDGQSLRAARVVLDIGVHCGFEAPAEVGGGEWTYEKAWEFLGRHTSTEESSLRFELDRYLGWPGQAPSYKVGERLWLELREEVERREGSAFDVKAFHRRALDIGGVGLDTLRSAVLQDW